jgi:hypothetical protein
MAKPAQPEEGVALALRGQAGDGLVAAGIQRADDHRAAGGPLEHLAVDLVERRGHPHGDVLGAALGVDRDTVAGLAVDLAALEELGDLE